MTAVAPEDDEDFAALLAASEAAAPRRQAPAVGETVCGRVVAVGATTAFVSIGAAADAAIDVAEFRDPGTGEVALHEGDEIEATVVDDGAASGSIVLRRVAGRRGHVPGEIEQAFRAGVAVEGVVTGQNKGGFDVQLGPVRAFCPASQIDRRRGDPAAYVGERLRFRVTKLGAHGRDVVVSRRRLLEEEAAREGAATWAALREGAVVQGTVTSLRDFGAFVDIGGIDGLIHVSELGWARVAHPSEVLVVGERVEAKVVRLEPGTGGGPGRVGLSLRALVPDPWTTARERFAVGSTTTGTVRRLEPFGAFVELAPGLDGLVHVSRMALAGRVSHPRQVVSVGDVVEVTVVTLDLEKRRIGLSMVARARADEEAAAAEARRDTEARLAEEQAGGFGTLGDLLRRR
jgi:small subunit ribosomal protein S1